MILQETINAVMAAMDIEGVIKDFVNLKKSGANYKGLSPFTNELTPSFMVSPEKQIFKCFSSGKGGNAVTFIMEHEQLNYPEAIRYLAKKYNIEVLETEKTDEEKQDAYSRESLYIINDAAQKFFVENLSHNVEAFSLITSRGYSPATLAIFGVGYSPGTLTALTNYLVTQSGYNWQLCVQTSLIGYKDNTIFDRFRDRFTFPIKNLAGRIDGYGGRATAWHKKDKYPKYLNSSDSLIYNKSNVVYGLFESKKAITEAGYCLLSEGYTDVIGFHEAGIKNIVAVSGTSFTEEQARLIFRYTKNITVLFDGDGPGIKAALRGIDIALTQGFSVKVCILPNGEDPDKFRIGKSKDEIFEYIQKHSKDFIIFKLKYLLDGKEDFSNQANAITEIVSSISKIKNVIQREVYLKECSRITDIDIEPLRQMLMQAMNNDQEFFDIDPETMQQTSNSNRVYLIEQCEAKILQYLLVYKNEVLQFKDIVYEQTNMGLEEQVIITKTTVVEKIITEIVNEGLSFSNMQYSQIFDIAIRSDISDVNNWLVLFGAELSLICDRMRSDELAMSLSSFEKDGVRTYEYIMKSKQENLQNGLSEVLLFFKSLNVETMITEEMKKEVPDEQVLLEYLEFNHNLKSKLNLI